MREWLNTSVKRLVKAAVAWCRVGSMPVESATAAFRDLSVRSTGATSGDDPREAYLLAKAKGKEGKRRVARKRVHLFRQPLVCDACLTCWHEHEFQGNERKLFVQTKSGPLLHRGCTAGPANASGVVRPYLSRVPRDGELTFHTDVSQATILRLATEGGLFSDPGMRAFFPSMGNLVREDMPDTSHHNSACTGECCATDQDGSLGPEPTAAAAVDIVVSYSTLSGWEEQAHKTCAAASVAGALNTALQGCPPKDEPTAATPPLQRASSESSQPRRGWAIAGDKDGKRSESSGAKLQPPTPGKDGRDIKGRGRVVEQDVIDYYCKWARESQRINIHANLRGSCGLMPSTRNIGNPRLVRACHAVGLSFVNREDSTCKQGGDGLVSVPTVGQDPRTASDEDDEVEEKDQASPVETLRLLGNWMCRDTIAEGGRCAPDDDDEVETAQWELVKSALADGSSLLLHFRNHYALVFAVREWKCGSTGAWRRQLLTATQKQRPHVWFCFRQLRADIVYSKNNQLLLIRRTSVSRPHLLPLSSASSNSGSS